MGNSQYPNEQQAEAPPPQKYELPEEDRKAGFFRRFSVGLLISGVFVLLKDVLFGWGEAATARADSVINSDPGNKKIGPPSLVLIETPEPIDQGALDQKPSPDPNRANSPSTSIDSFSTVEQPIYVGPVQVRLGSGRPLAATKDNESTGPAVGSDVNDLLPQVGNRITGLGSGGGGGGSGGNPKSDGVTATDDPRPTGNRAPVVTRPARLNNILVDQTVIIATAGLLQNVTDADGDVLSIQNLAASSGNLVDTGTGTWSFTPNLNDSTEVTFTYNVTDGTDSTPQAALLDLLRPPGKTSVGTDAPDTIISTPSNDIIDAHGGDETVVAGEGIDTIYGGDGDDRILGGEGDDRIFGGEGDDVIFGGSGDDAIFGGDGDDAIFGGDGNDVIHGENGQDLVLAGAGDDIVDGGAGDDRIIATVLDGDDSYSGGAGTDTYDLSVTEADAIVDLASGTANSFQTGHDSLSDIENVIGGVGDDTIVGSDGNNLLQGGPGSDEIDGGAGDDRFIATVSDGNDSYSGGAGTDTYDLSGTEAGVVVDLARGRADGAEIGHDNLSGIENVVGGSGDDTFKASQFFNVFTGGEGNDIFEFGGILNANAIGVVRDQITDFQVGDKIDLSEFDAILLLAGNPDFELVVDKLEFSDSGKVEVRFQGFGQDERTVVEIKIDDNGEFETEIELHGHHDLTKDDFIGVS